MERDIKKSRVRWAFRHQGGDSGAVAEYRRTYGEEPDQPIIRHICAAAVGELNPDPYGVHCPKLQQTDGFPALMARFGYENPHMFRLWWDRQPSEWKERMNGVDRETLFGDEPIIHPPPHFWPRINRVERPHTVHPRVKSKRGVDVGQGSRRPE